MWCDNCLLLFPLRAGAIAWALLIAIYSVVGGVLLFEYGDFLYFTYPEWDIYGGISMVVGAAAILNALALLNRSPMFCNVCRFIWPTILVISAVRGIVMLARLNTGKTDFAWECANGGQSWYVYNTTTPAEAAAQAAANVTTTVMPSELCTDGYEEVFTAMVVGILVDVVCQAYMLFLNWRYIAKMEYKELPIGFGNGVPTPWAQQYY